MAAIFFVRLDDFRRRMIFAGVCIQADRCPAWKNDFWPPEKIIFLVVKNAGWATIVGLVSYYVDRLDKPSKHT